MLVLFFNRYIKLSSPKLNDMALIGCILVYTSVILFGLDDENVKEEHFAVICSVSRIICFLGKKRKETFSYIFIPCFLFLFQSRAFLLAAGFSAAFGAMFTKTYRVHEIFTRAHSGVIRSKVINYYPLID